MLAAQVFMDTSIDVARLSHLVRTKRAQDALTLRDVQEATGIPIPTISRIEHRQTKDIGGSTLILLATWLNCSLDQLRSGAPVYPTDKGRSVEATPDVVDVFLRADKNLEASTAEALSKMFRTAYEAFASQRPVQK